MNILQRVVAAFRGHDPQNATVGTAWTPELEAALLGRAAGKLDWQQAIQISTVLRCAVIRAEGICSVPFKLYKKEGNDRVEARDHPLWDVIHTSPNEWQTSFEFRKTIGLHLALEGNAYVWLNRVRGQIVEMIPFEPSKVTVRRHQDWSIDYLVNMPDGTQIVISSKDMWHLKNHSWDAYKGLSALEYARKAMSLTSDLEKGQSDTHKYVARPSGVLSVGSEMDSTQFKETRKLIDAQVGSRLSKGLPMVVDKTMTWTQMAVNAVDTQTIESRGFQVEETGRAMGVLPIMLGHSGKGISSYASAEQMFIHHFVHSTRVDHRNVEQSADKWLLSRKDRAAGYYTGLVDQELLRGDTKTRGEFYRLLWMIGAVTGNEIRAFEEMNSLPGIDRPWAPLNSAPIGEDGMPMIAETQALDNNFKTGDAAAFIESFKAASPMTQQLFLSHMRNSARPGGE